MKHMKMLRVAAVGFAFLAVIALASGAAFAGSGDVRAEGEFQQPSRSTLASRDFPGATGEFKLRRRDRGSGPVEFRFEAKGKGIHTRQDITLCVGATNIDTDDPEDRGRWELDETDRTDLRPRGSKVPDISSGTVTIRKGVGCRNPNTVILTATFP